ncbi:MAG: hypothetical protein ACXACP_03205 [Candidatus Hodarchaeales archaeon]
MILRRPVKHIVFLSIVCLGVQSFLISANGSVLVVSWKQDYDYSIFFDYPISVQTTQDGGFVILGCTSEMAGSSYHVIKTDSEGRRVWSVKWGSDFHVYVTGESIISTDDGGYIVLGLRQVASYGHVAKKSFEVYKLNSEGKFTLLRRENFSNEEVDFFIQVSNDEEYKITANSVTRIDSTGREIWKKSRNATLITNTLDGGLVKLDSEWIYDANERSFMTLTKFFFVDECPIPGGLSSFSDSWSACFDV